MNPSAPHSDKKTTKKRILWAGLLLLAVALLFLTHDIIITNILAYRICKADPQPKTFINKTVEYPESIYWEDNVYPGFDEKDRLLMIRNYLDGVHLKTMALNAPDGTIHVYTATEEDWLESSAINKETQQDWKDYFAALEKEAQKIADQGQTCTRQTMPRLNYSIIFNVVPLTTFERRYLWSDEVTITDGKTKEVIAYNRRLMRRWHMIEIEPMGGCISMTQLYHEAKCGDPLQYSLDDNVFFKNISTDNILKNIKCKKTFKSKL
ncbi:MAG: hypothetical protein RBR03_03570 [Desulfuromonas thiophila]|jgi:hypothetical protein|nr:hypothetical protein [Desulfuromonas thiophila]